MRHLAVLSSDTKKSRGQQERNGEGMGGGGGKMVGNVSSPLCVCFGEGGAEGSVCNGFLIMLLKPPHAVGPSSPRSNFVGDKQW